MPESRRSQNAIACRTSTRQTTGLICTPWHCSDCADIHRCKLLTAHLCRELIQAHSHWLRCHVSAGLAHFSTWLHTLMSATASVHAAGLMYKMNAVSLQRFRTSPAVQCFFWGFSHSLTLGDSVTPELFFWPHSVGARRPRINFSRPDMGDLWGGITRVGCGPWAAFLSCDQETP